MQDCQSTGPKLNSRRGFFIGAGMASAAAAAVTALPKVVGVPGAAATRALQAAPGKGGGYSLSEHVKRYYQTTLA